MLPSSRQFSGHMQNPSDEDDRLNRFDHPTGPENGSGSLRERAASQPPRTSDQNFLASPGQQFNPSSFGASKGSPWITQRILSPTRSAQPQPVTIRSSSFSAQSQGKFSSTMRDRAFPSTFEDDEDGDEIYVQPSLSRNRPYNDVSRSRSQSIATSTRPGPIGSFLGSGSAVQSWNDNLSSNPLNIPGRYGEIKPPGSSRYGSLGPIGRSSIDIHVSSPSGGSVIGNGYYRQNADISNMSPFVRDVGQILLDDGSAFRELWAGMHVPRDENGGGGSGTTSRRHSVSVVQPRRGNIVGFNAPGVDGPDESIRTGFSQSALGRSGLMIDDEDLASDLGLLNINPNEPPSHKSSSNYPPSQPASLPIYAPISRSPASRDILSPYQTVNLNLNIPSGSYTSRNLHTPSDGGISAGANSPSVSTAFDKPFGSDVQYSNGSSRQAQTHSPERYIQQNQGIPYQTQAQQGGASYARARVPSISSPVVSPNGRIIPNPQQQPFYPQQLQRRPSIDTTNLATPQQSQQQHQALSELGRGVPLHAVPTSWPLYIVEFKAGRTDLFYCTDPSLHIRVGDLVIVEADRGKDLGKVVNDSITVEEVEAFQRDQQDRSGMFGSGGGSGDGQQSPGGTGQGVGASGKKEINPKMIYGKAQPQDAGLLMTKLQDEHKALQLCQSKVRAKKLPMEVIDAEYQWDRRKLTFYFIAEKRIDFRELVRELFRLYKTRIWMASLQGGAAFEQ